MWWLHKQIPDTEEGRQRWVELTAALDTPPTLEEGEPVPAALPPGTPVTPAAQAAAFDAFAAMA